MRRKLSALLVVALLLGVMTPAAFAASFDIKTIIEPQYEGASSFSDDLAAVKQGGKWGYIDRDNKMVIAPKYDYAGDFSEGVAVAALCVDHEEDENWEWSLYDLYLLKADGTEKKLSTIGWDGEPWDKQYDDDYGPIEDVAFSWFCTGGAIEVDGTPYTPDGNEIIPKAGQLDVKPYADEKALRCEMTGPCVAGVIPMIAYGLEGRQCFFMDISGNVTRKFPVWEYDGSGISRVYAPDQGRIIAFYLTAGEDEDGFWYENEYVGALDMAGNWAIQPIYTNFRYYLDGRFFTDGLWAVSKDGEKFGAIDKDGKVVVPFEYDFLSSSSEGMLAGQKGDGFHYLDTTGKRYDVGALSGDTAVRADAAAGFNNGVAPVYVSADGKAYCIQNTPKNGILPAIPGTDALDRTVYFPQYQEGSDDLGLIRSVGGTMVIQKDGKYGFAEMEFTLDLPDVSAMDSWAYDEVCKAIEAGLVPNSLQNQYRSNITRADFALLLTEVATVITDKDLETLVKDTTGKTLDEIKASAPFVDDTSDAVLAANALGIIKGDGQGNFLPYDTISRQDAATMLLRAATAIKADAMEGWGDKIAQANVQFDDGNAFADYAREAIGVMAALDVMKGVGDNQFAPNEKYTRQQSFMTVYRLMNQILDKAETEK